MNWQAKHNLARLNSPASPTNFLPRMISPKGLTSDDDAKFLTT